MKRVLIAVDYNPVSEKVVNSGYEMAKIMGAKICLMHVMASVNYYGTHFPAFMGDEGFNGLGEVEVNLASEMRKIAEEYLKSLSEHLNDPNVCTYLAEGDTGNAILDYAEEWKADIIVMGTHSHSVLEKLLMGTVASKVLEKTRIPVFMVPVKDKKGKDK